MGTLSAAFVVDEVPGRLDFIAAGFIMLVIAGARLPTRQNVRA